MNNASTSPAGALRNAAVYAERRPPEEVVGYLDRRFDHMIEIIHGRHGIAAQRLGDGCVPIFGPSISHGMDSHTVEAPRRAVPVTVFRLA